MDLERPQTISEQMDLERPQTTSKRMDLKRPQTLSRARLTKFERSRLLAVRALQLTEGESPLTEIPPLVRDPVAIATIELEKGCLGHFKVRRTLLDGTTEEWTVNELLF